MHLAIRINACMQAAACIIQQVLVFPEDDTTSVRSRALRPCVRRVPCGFGLHGVVSAVRVRRAERVGFI